MPRIDTERWRVLAPHLDLALDLPGDARSSLLSSLRSSDPQLADELQTLLAELDEVTRDGFLQHGLSSIHGDLGRHDAESPAELGASRYDSGQEVARGGMGRILRARDTYLDRTVAIKELLYTNPEAEARFEREAKLTARLQHPSIVPVYDTGRWRQSGKAFYSMKLVGGSALDELVTDAAGLSARLPLLPHVLAVADALAYAHSESVIHRDIKPANILVGPYGETLVVDWGLAKELDGPAPSGAGTRAASEQFERSEATMTQAGSVLGTPAYMPPEQARGDQVDASADVYSLGATLYFLIVARPPFEVGATHDETLARVLAGPPPPIASLEPEAPADLCTIVEKAMARSAADRYPSAQELAADLRKLLTGQMVSAHRYSWQQVLARWAKRNRALTIVSVLSLLTLMVGAGGFLLREQRLRLAAEGSSRRAAAQTRALRIEHARRDLALGRPLRAAAYLAEAYIQEPGNQIIQHLMTEAARPLRSHTRTLSGHARDVVAVAFSADGRRLATGSADRTVRLWDTDSGTSLRVLRGAKYSVEDVALSRDGKWVASAEDVICIWDAESGKLLQTLSQPGFRLQFSRDDKWLVAGSMNGWIRVWDTATWNLVHELRPYRDRVAAIAFHPDGGQAVTVSWDGLATLWELPTWRPRKTLDDHRNMLSTAAYSADGRWLLTGDRDYNLFVRDARDGAVKHAIRLPDGSHGMNAFFGPEGNTILTVTVDGVIRAWHATSGALLQAVDAVPDGKLFDSALSPDGHTVATVGLEGGDLWHLDRSASYRILRGERHEPSKITAALYSADGRWVIAGIEATQHREHSLHIWNAATGAEIASWLAAGCGYRLAASASLARVVSGHGRDVTLIYDSSSGRAESALDHHGQWVRALAMTQDGSIVASGGDLGMLQLWRAGISTRIETDMERTEAVSTMTFGPSATELTIGDSRGYVSRYDVFTGQRTFQLKASSTQIEDVHYSADGRWFVTAGRQDHTARVWQTETGRLQATLTGHSDNLTQASFNPDATRVATVSADNTARIWDAQSGDLLRVIHGPSYSALFSPDGRELMTTGLDDYMVVWDMALDLRSPAELARRLAERQIHKDSSTYLGGGP